MPKLESVVKVLMHCNVVKNDSSEASKVLFTFLPNKQFEKLISISPHSLIMLDTVNADF